MKVVERGVNEEFNSYKSVPEVEKAILGLEKYFFKNAPAYNRIVEVLGNEKKRNWTLNNEGNPSTFELLGLNCNYVEGNLAVVETEEHWLINWYDTATKRYVYNYDLTNKQTYYLKKENDKTNWKIIANNYPTDKNKIQPVIFDDKDFDPKTKKEKLKYNVINFLSQGDTQAAIWLIRKYAETHQLPIFNEVTIMQGNLNEKIRLLNTMEINLSDYEKSVTKINREILDRFLKKI